MIEEIETRNLYNTTATEISVDGHLLAPGAADTLAVTERVSELLAGGALADAPIAGDYARHAADALQVEAERRGLHVEGTGSGGNVLKADLVAALEAHDAATNPDQEA